MLAIGFRIEKSKKLKFGKECDFCAQRFASDLKWWRSNALASRLSVLSDGILQQSQEMQRCGEEHIAPAELGDSLCLFPILISHVDVDPMLFFSETNGLIKGSSIVIVMVEAAVVVERPPNMRKRSSMVRYAGGGGDII